MPSDHRVALLETLKKLWLGSMTWWIGQPILWRLYRRCYIGLQLLSQREGPVAGAPQDTHTDREGHTFELFEDTPRGPLKWTFFETSTFWHLTWLDSRHHEGTSRGVSRERVECAVVDGTYRTIASTPRGESGEPRGRSERKY